MLEGPSSELLGPRVLGIGVSGKTCGFVVIDPWTLRHYEIKTLRQACAHRRARVLAQTVFRINELHQPTHVVVEKPGHHKLRYPSVQLTYAAIQKLGSQLSVPIQFLELPRCRAQLCNRARPTRAQVGEVLGLRYPELARVAMPKTRRVATDKDKYWQHVLDAATLAQVVLDKAKEGPPAHQRQ